VAGSKREVVERSNREALEHVLAPTQRIDVANYIRASLANDVESIPPDVAASLVAWTELFDPEVEMDTSGVDMPGFGELRGLRGMRELWRRWIEEWERYSWAQTNWTEIGEHVIADVEIRATGRGSGVDVVWEHAQVFTFRDGKIIRWRVVADRAAALAAIADG
jgi:ketosteroid isomerase-like protein